MSLAAYPAMEAHGERSDASCQGRRDGSKRDGGHKEGGQGAETGGRRGGEEGEKSAEWGTRAARVLEDCTVIDMRDTICIESGIID